jgi:hypothetical protein
MKIPRHDRVRISALRYVSEDTTVEELNRYIDILKARQSYLVQLTRRILNKILPLHAPGYDSRANEDARIDAKLLIQGVHPDHGVTDPEVAQQVGDMGLAEVDRSIAKLTLRRDRLIAGLEAFDRVWPDGVPPIPGGAVNRHQERLSEEDAQLRAFIDAHEVSR